MHQADAEKAAGFFYVQLLGEVESVVVSIPCEEALIAEFGGEGERSLILCLINDSQGDRGTAPAKRAGSVMP